MYFRYGLTDLSTCQILRNRLKPSRNRMPLTSMSPCSFHRWTRDTRDRPILFKPQSAASRVQKVLVDGYQFLPRIVQGAE